MPPPVAVPGHPLPLGATVTPFGINFSLVARHASAVTLVGQEPAGGPPWQLALDPARHRTGDVWHCLVSDLPAGVRYGYRLDGPRGGGHAYSPAIVTLDPRARALAGTETWGQAAPWGRAPLCLVPDGTFDWQGDRPLRLPWSETIIYELHIRGFTRHPSARVEHPGTYLGLVEKIPYLRRLGITAVELLPVFE
ncbi:MAG: glycogen debranching enzyme, partial [Thermodesulfobacteriota bacterium]